MKNSSIIRAFPPSRPRPNAPKTPKGLSSEARKWWRAIQDGYGITDSAGLLLLQTAAEQFDAMRSAERLIASEGAVLTDRFGQRKQHPATIVARDARLAMLRCLQHLNLDLEPLNDRVGRPAGRIGG